jgi:hypothetical protein
MVLLLFVSETGCQHSKQVRACGNREATPRVGRGTALEIGHGRGEEALSIGVQDDNTDAAEAGMNVDPAERQAQPIQMVVGIDNRDSLMARGCASNRGIV